MNTPFDNEQPLNHQQDSLLFPKPDTLDLADFLDKTSERQLTPLASEMTTRNEEVQQPVNQELKRVDDFSQSTRDIDQQYQHLMDKDWSLWDKLTDRTMYNQVQQIRKDLLVTSAKYRLNFYKTILDARLGALNEKCDAGLKMIKAHYRQQVSSHLMAKMEELTIEVKSRQINFLEMMKEKYQYSESLKNYPSMQKRYLDCVFEEEGRYLKFLDSLILRFESIVTEQLTKYN